ncbi:MAG: SAM-dependent methyltransferase [Ruminococcaceae bacterium]|nr:SAM-dependent methyltransferase [Oscillospiraceae bacterium]
MANIVLDNRMTCIAECVRRGAVLADIGTDHGKLPVYLAQTGRISRAVAADINDMPLKKAESNIEKHGLSAVIDTCLTDGLVGIEKYSPTDVVIAGMGGELIENILEKATIDKNGVKFILQPMTKEDSLRQYLCENGYEIIDEYIVKEGKIYQIICAVYNGMITKMESSEYLLGRINIEKRCDLLGELLEKVIKRTKAKLDGKASAGIEAEDEKKCLDELIKISENMRV